MIGEGVSTESSEGVSTGSSEGVSTGSSDRWADMLVATLYISLSLYIDKALCTRVILKQSVISRLHRGVAFTFGRGVTAFGRGVVFHSSTASARTSSHESVFRSSDVSLCSTIGTAFRTAPHGHPLMSDRHSDVVTDNPAVIVYNHPTRQTSKPLPTLVLPYVLHLYKAFGRKLYLYKVQLYLYNSTSLPPRVYLPYLPGVPYLPPPRGGLPFCQVVYPLPPRGWYLLLPPSLPPPPRG